MPTNEIRNLHYIPPKWEAYYDLGLAEELRSVLLTFEYFTPGIIHFKEVTEIDEEFPKPGLWMWLPFKAKSKQAYSYYTINFMPVLYMGDKWKVQPLMEE